MKKILLLLFPLFLACSSQVTDEELAHKVFAAVKNDNAQALLECVVKREDITYVDDHAGPSERLKNRMKIKMSRETVFWEVRYKERLNHTRKLAKDVDWESAEFDKVENKSRMKNGLELSDILVYFHDKNQKWTMELDDCIKTDRGWVMMDDIRCHNFEGVTEEKKL
jgi:hypothetical protein